ncbi:Hypothetical protein CINCED_3A016224 [Cinara cedri]|uniref:Alpha-(1,6)-fucosyltransferase n=1 Tax=Cinara cedri TaxID=506608 RepID=A0A5E4M0X0_9HEMI|nr:Hypothetical protein CINCED_3A016224 [Cinara cedri]
MEISVGERYRSLLKDISDLTKVDDYATWRQEESENLSSLVQNRLDDLQNPAECSKAKQLVCNLKKKCSFGCQLHHIVYCFIVAYATRRTFVLDSENWSYAAKWQNIFFPLSDTCSFSVNRTIVEWSGIDDKYAQVIFLPIIDELRNRPSYLPQNIPYDLASRLSTLHGDPIVWWIGQFLKYLIRPQAITSRQLDEVHIRRTDTIIYEAKIHKLDEYMTHVEEYYKIRQLQSDAVIIKRIYLATDDPTLFTEAKLKYPEYEIIGDEEISRTTDVLVYHNVALNGIVDDIYFLSLCDYLVCTFSSQVCRTAYEIMNTLHPDASSLYTSLDDVYYYGGQNFRLNKAVLAHESDGPDEIDLQVNDEIHVAGNHWNGYSKGTNIRTGITGLYPTFKVVPVIQSANFSLHNEQYTEF